MSLHVAGGDRVWPKEGLYGSSCHGSAVRYGIKSLYVTLLGHAQLSRSGLLVHDSATIVRSHCAAMVLFPPGLGQQKSCPVSGQTAKVPASQNASPKCSWAA